MHKYDVVNRLIAAHGLRRFLCIRTETTGKIVHGDAELDAAPLARVERIAYRCSGAPMDAHRIDRRSRSRSSAELIAALRGEGAAFDAVFIDPWHTYEATLDDLYGALQVMAPGGVIVLHDVSPPDRARARARPSGGGWFGETYAAFIDFAATSWVAGRFTVDCDFGCGVAYVGEGLAAPALARRPTDRALAAAWRTASRRERDRWSLFEARRAELLNLVSAEAFAAQV